MEPWVSIVIHPRKLAFARARTCARQIFSKNFKNFRARQIKKILTRGAQSSRRIWNLAPRQRTSSPRALARQILKICPWRGRWRAKFKIWHTPPAGALAAPPQAEPTRRGLTSASRWTALLPSAGPARPWRALKGAPGSGRACGGDSQIRPFWPNAWT